jgi:hypothetical protein
VKEEALVALPEADVAFSLAYYNKKRTESHTLALFKVDVNKSCRIGVVSCVPTF